MRRDQTMNFFISNHQVTEKLNLKTFSLKFKEE